ncbi:DUF1513 domain-containing protein [Vibrio lentus]|nr:DUF1513 domain-containing protein [Vibrio lentus]
MAFTIRQVLPYATEGKTDSSQGVIGAIDVAWRYRGPSRIYWLCIGPREVIIMPDGNLAIGVGGVHTDGRTPKTSIRCNRV